MPITTETGKKENRELRIHCLGTKVASEVTGAADDVIVRIGRGITDMSRAQAWNTTSEKDVTGVVDASTTRGEETLDVDPYYCRADSPLAARLQEIDESELELDDIKGWYYEAKVDGDGETIYAWKKLADIMPQSFGGSAENADSIPFNLALGGKKISLDFDFSTMAFSEITTP